MKEHIRFSIFRINTIQTIDVTREKKSKSFQVVGWFYNFSQDCIYTVLAKIIEPPHKICLYEKFYFSWCTIFSLIYNNI